MYVYIRICIYIIQIWLFAFVLENSHSPAETMVLYRLCCCDGGDGGNICTTVVGDRPRVSYTVPVSVNKVSVRMHGV